MRLSVDRLTRVVTAGGARSSEKFRAITCSGVVETCARRGAATEWFQSSRSSGTRRGSLGSMTAVPHTPVTQPAAHFVTQLLLCDHQCEDGRRWRWAATAAEPTLPVVGQLQAGSSRSSHRRQRSAHNESSH